MLRVIVGGFINNTRHPGGSIFSASLNFSVIPRSDSGMLDKYEHESYMMKHTATP